MFVTKLTTSLLVTTLVLFVSPVVLAPPTVLAQNNIRTQRVQFSLVPPVPLSKAQSRATRS
jgi:hypothetical protein